MGRKKEEEKGLILNSDFLRFLCQFLSNEEIFIKKDYDDCVDFFNQVLTQKLEEHDKFVIKKYYSWFLDRHKSRLNFWNDFKKPYERREGNGRS